MPILQYSCEKPQRGQKLGRKYKIKEIYIDPEKRVFVGYVLGDRINHFYKYALLGELKQATQQ